MTLRIVLSTTPRWLATWGEMVMINAASCLSRKQAALTVCYALFIPIMWQLHIYSRRTFISGSSPLVFFDEIEVTYSLLASSIYRASFFLVVLCCVELAVSCNQSLTGRITCPTFLGLEAGLTMLVRRSGRETLVS